MIKKEKEQTKTSKSTPKIPSDKSKMAGYIEVPDAQIKRTSIPWSSNTRTTQ